MELVLILISVEEIGKMRVSSMFIGGHPCFEILDPLLATMNIYYDNQATFTFELILTFAKGQNI